MAFIIYSNKSFTQTSIDYDNMLDLKIYCPDEQYMKNRVKQVTVYKKRENEKKYLCDDFLVDNEGYVVLRKRFDKFRLNDTEVITIERNGFNFIVNRIINKYSLLRGGLIPSSFWEVYFGVLKYAKSDTTENIKIKSIYKGTKDSSFNFVTFVNDNKVDSGFFVTEFTSVSIDSSRIPMNLENLTINDTLVVRAKEKINDSSYVIKEKYYYNNFLVKEKSLNYSKDLLIGFGFDIYKYDDRGRKICKVVYQNGGKYYSGTTYEYDDSRNTYTIMEDTDNADNRFDYITKYNSSGLVLESIQNVWAPDFIERKWVFLYESNGLLKEKQYWNTGILIDKYYYHYAYYQKIH
jgi:hypothetical protein